jgi:hypothetical protein
VWAPGPIDLTTYRHKGRMCVGPWPYRQHNVPIYRPQLCVGPWSYRHHDVPTYRLHSCGPMARQTSQRTDIQAVCVWALGPTDITTYRHTGRICVWAHGPTDITTYRHTGYICVGPWPYRHHNVPTYRPHVCGPFALQTSQRTDIQATFVCGPMALKTSRRTDIQATFVWAHGPKDITTYQHTGYICVGPSPYRHYMQVTMTIENNKICLKFSAQIFLQHQTSST